MIRADSLTQLKRAWACWLVSAMLAAGGAPALSQTLDPDVFPIDMVSPVLPQMTLQTILDADRPASGQKRAATGPSPSGGGAVTTYVAAAAVSGRVKKLYVDHVRASAGPEAATSYQRILAQSDHVKNWAALTVEEGFRPGDVADAFASYWMLNYLMANGLVDGPAGRGQAVKRQVRDVLLQDTTFAQLGDAQRQELAETYMLNFLTQQAAYGQAVKTGDANLKRRLGEAAVARFRQGMGVDLKRLTLTPNGFAAQR